MQQFLFLLYLFLSLNLYQLRLLQELILPLPYLSQFLFLFHLIPQHSLEYLIINLLFATTTINGCLHRSKEGTACRRELGMGLGHLRGTHQGGVLLRMEEVVGSCFVRLWRLQRIHVLLVR
jgi:hypothetical protein